MKVILLSLFICVSVCTAFDCFGQNNTCADSHITCDTGYTPFCEHMPGPHGMNMGICTCDKACTAAADCSNAADSGCPPHAHPVCDTMHKVCHCHGPPPHGGVIG